MFKHRRTLVLIGLAVALLAGLAIAVLMVRTPHGGDGAPPASQGGLVVQTGRDDDIKLDPIRPLRCFVGGQFVGELPLGVCAKRNGVATGALDVGLDPNGALAASNGPSSEITPLSPDRPAPSTDSEASDAQPSETEATNGRPTAACSTYDDGVWNREPGEVTLAACASEFAQACPGPSGVAYGRWGDQTLRAVSSRASVEISGNNRDFRFLMKADARCAASE